MANNYLTSDLLAKEAAAQVAVASTFLMTGNKKYENLYSQKYFTPGDTISLPLDNRYKLQRGDSVTAQDIVDRKITMTIGDLYTELVTVKPTDFQRNIRDFGEMFFQPAAHTIAAGMNNAIAANALTTAYIHGGVVGTPINSFSTLRNARADMLKFAMPKRQRWYAALSLDDGAALQNALSNQFNTDVNSPILNDASLGRLAGFDIYEDQSIQVEQGYTGAIGTPTVKTTVASGSSVVLTGLTPTITGIITAGTLLTFDGVFAMDPVRHVLTTKKFQAVVLADATSDGGGDATVSISPTINTTATDPLQNCSASIVAGTVVTISQNYNANLLYTDMALYCAMPALQPFAWAKSSTFTDKESGVSCRVSITSDIQNNKDYIRMDCQLANAWNPEQMMVLMS